MIRRAPRAATALSIAAAMLCESHAFALDLGHTETPPPATQAVRHHVIPGALPQRRLGYGSMTPQEAAAGEAVCQIVRSTFLEAINDVPKLRNVLSASGRCPDSGPEMVAALWRQRGADSSTLVHLTSFAEAMKDARIADAALSVLQDRSRSQFARVRAAEALAAQMGVNLGFDGRVIPSYTLVDFAGNVVKVGDDIAAADRWTTPLSGT